MKEFLKQKNKKTKGFVLLYTMILSSIIFAVTFGIISIALKETNFSISARAANEAFFAADTGAECALFYDKITNNAFSTVAATQISCAKNNITLSPPQDDSVLQVWDFEVSGLGGSGNACAKVTFTRDQSNFSTIVISKGYNNCDLTVGNVVERELKVTY